MNPIFIMCYLFNLVCKQDYKEKEKMREKLQPQASALLGDISKFAIKNDEAAWQAALKGGPNTVISVKR